jgi:5-methylcytosine-specific restriction endonuclease McrA
MKNFDPKQEHDLITMELRSYVVIRDNALCVVCGMRGDDLHHVKYRSSGGTHKANNLALLCKRCHNDIHFGVKAKEYKVKIKNQIELNEKRLRRYLV